MFLQWDGLHQQWQPLQQWSGNDRALNYGDGLFETLRFNAQGQIPLWAYHQERLAAGLAALHFPSTSLNSILSAIDALPAAAKAAGAGKLLVSRGQGQRGYALPEPTEIQLLWQIFSPPQWALARFPEGVLVEPSPVQLSRQPLLAGIKHLNRLEQVLARRHFSAQQQEAILCDTEGWVIEGCMSNLFIIRQQQLQTPPLTYAGVNGVIRRWLCTHNSVQEQPLQLQDVLAADALFFCNSLNGIMPAACVGSHSYSMSPAIWEQLKQLQRRLECEFC